MRLPVRPALLVIATVTALGTAACGEADKGTDTAPEPRASSSSTPTRSVSPTATPTEPPLPACSTVWVAGKRLSDEYVGCTRAGTTVTRNVRCETGQQLFIYDQRFWAVAGGTIFRAEGRLADDPRFAKLHRACSA